MWHYTGTGRVWTCPQCYSIAGGDPTYLVYSVWIHRNLPLELETITMCTRIRVSIRLSLFMSLLAAGTGHAVVTNMTVELEEDHELSMEFETPHTDWAQPYAQGPVNVLYFGYGGSGRGIEARDLVELKQRFDVEAEAAFFQRIPDKSDFSWVGGSDGLARIEDLTGGSKWDCYLFNGISPDLMLSYRIVRDRFMSAYYGADKSGRDLDKAGLVLIGVNDPHLTRAADRIQNKESPVPGADAFETAFGRVVRLPARPKIDFHPGWQVEWDHWMERVGRAILWASGKEPRVALHIELPNEPMSRAALMNSEARLWWTGEPVGNDITFSARLRSAEGTTFDLPMKSPRPGEHELTLNIARSVRAGKHHLDVFGRSAEGIETWVTREFEVTSDRTVAGVRLEREWGENGDSIDGRVVLDGDGLGNEQLLVRLKDVHGRIESEGVVKSGASGASFSFPVESWMPMLLEVRAVLLSEGSEVSSAYAYFHAVRRHRGQFNFVVWTPGGAFSAVDWPYDTLAPYANQQLARIGCTAQLSGSRASWRGWPFLPAAANNISLVPYATRITTSWDKNGHMTIPHTSAVCWNNAEAIQEWIEINVRKCKGIRQHGVFVYGLGDEGASSGSCVHPLCMETYQRYLEREYGDIARLNESWGEEYAGFDQVDLLVTGDNEEEEALRRGLKARWFDRQAFQSWNLVNYAGKFADGFRSLDPQAISGYEGSGRFADGADIDLVCRRLGYWAPYPGLQDEVLRSIAPPGFIMSNWMGYHKGTGDLLGQYWRMVTLGFDSVWFWRWSGLGPYKKHVSYHGLINGAMVPFRAVKEMVTDTQIVRDGLGTLLQQCRREDHGIAMIYSYPSQFAIETGPGISYGDTEGHEMGPLKDRPNRDGKESLIVYEKNHVSWHRSLRATGLNFSYVTDRMLRLGEFKAEDYRVLILSQIEALGDKEAGIIRRFAEDGGTVIADVRPAVYDGHCKRAEPGPLDDLFGIRRTGDAHASVTDGKIDGTLGEYAVRVALSELKVDRAIEVTTGKPMGQAGSVPLCIVNRVEKGQAILLNFAMDSFPHIHTADAPDGAIDLIRSLLASGGVTPEIELTAQDGSAIVDTEITQWRGPGVDFVSLFGAMSLRGRRMMYIANDEAVDVRMSQVRHVYDLRAGRDLGPVDRFTTEKLGNRATFLVISDKKLNAPVVTPAGATWRRGQTESVGLSYPGSDATHAVRFEVYHPDDTHAEWQNQVLHVPAGGVHADVRIAHNDPEGEWTIRTRDLYTGEIVETRVSVR